MIAQPTKRKLKAMTNPTRSWRHSLCVAALTLSVMPMGALAQDRPLTSAAEDGASLRAEIERQKARLTQEIQLLHEQLQNLQELERRVLALEAAQLGATGGERPGLRPALEAPVAGPAATAVAQATPRPDKPAATIENLRDNDQPLTGRDLIDDDFPKSWPLFGSDYRMSFGGYVKLDYLQDFSGTGSRFQFITASIPVDGTPEAGVGGYMNLFARETRFGFEVRKTTPDGPPQKYFVEMDFFQESAGAFNQFPRLRHAYFVYGNLVVGRTWGILTDTRSLPALIDFAAGDALAGTRAAQVRWEQRLSGGLKWTAGIQMQEFPGIENAFDQPGRPSQLLPVLEGRIEREWGSSFLMLGGGLGQLRWDGEGDGPDATATQWGAALSGRLALGARDSVVLNSSYGHGSGNGVVAFVGQGASAVLTPRGTLDTMPAWSVAVGYGHRFTGSLSSNLHFAWAEIEPSEFRAPDAMKASAAAHVNMLWNVTPNLTTGAEFMYGRRTNTDDRFGTAQRLQLMAKFGF